MHDIGAVEASGKTTRSQTLEVGGRLMSQVTIRTIRIPPMRLMDVRSLVYVHPPGS